MQFDSCVGKHEERNAGSAKPVTETIRSMARARILFNIEHLLHVQLLVEAVRQFAGLAEKLQKTFNRPR